MRHATLFSGIGAPELAAQWLGWENAFHCEINPFCQQVLKYWFNKSECYEDIAKTDFRKWEGKIDILTGGFPCQPFSVAGRRKGAEDNRYLWPEFKRVIREIRPRWIIGENVAGIISMVQPGQEIDLEAPSTSQSESDKETLFEQEFVTETICRDLESEGYTIQPIVIPACAVGAPHRRDRVWFIAHRNSLRLQKARTEQSTAGTFGENIRNASNSTSNGQFDWSSNWTKRSVLFNQEWDATENQPEWTEWKCRACENIQSDVHSNSNRLEGRSHEKAKNFSTFKPEKRSSCELWYWENFPTQPPLCGGDDGIPGALDIEAVFKGANHTGRASVFNRWRTESIKAYGNAMVPQVIYQIYKYINDIENRLNEKGTHTNL